MGFDLRRYAKETDKRMLVGFFLLLLVVGDGLIWLIYGRNAAVLGLICILAGLFPLALTGLALWFMDWFIKRQDD
jgi:uncharacterized SAM-binding protein YcdF (DUF218 family)